MIRDARKDSNQGGVAGKGRVDEREVFVGRSR